MGRLLVDIRQQAASAVTLREGHLANAPVLGSEKLSGMQVGWRFEPTWLSC